ncbi:MAG: hypothetical protein KC423_13850 [Anaerolineales bacterium]|nr:hypothetical protein [Anaerolineales bacterium]
MTRKTALILTGSLILGAGAAFAAFWLMRPQTPVAIGEAASGIVKILVDHDGVYRLTRDELAQAEFMLETWDSDNLRLRTGETAVPYLLHDDSLIFYGQAPSDRYTAQRPYLLEIGHPGTLINQRPVSRDDAPPVSEIRQTLFLEENHLYAAEATSQGIDLWYWQEIPQQSSLPVTLNLPSLSDAPAELRLQLRGVTRNPQVENDHDLDLWLNGQPLATVRFDGQTVFTDTIPIPSGQLKTGDNELLLDNTPEGASFLDVVQLNWVELTYATPPTAVNDRLQFSQTSGTLTLTGFSGDPVLLDITNPAQPQQLTSEGETAVSLTVTPSDHILAVGPVGFQKPASIEPVRQSTWRDSSNQADLLIVTTDQLAPALASLVEARQAEGLAVAVATTAEIYDAFGDGAASPESIHAFVRYAATQWAEPHPRYLFIVGDATSDYRNYLGLAPGNNVPSLMVPVQFSGETVSDSRLADIDNDTRPDLAVGRWPVSTVAEVEELVARTLAYEGETAVNRILFATDGTEPQFAQIAQQLTDNSGLDAATVSILNGPAASEVTAAWNNGGWLTSYVGHGSLSQWGKDDVFTLDAVNDLTATTPPIVVQLTCLSGLFAHPQQTSLSETMLRHKNGPVLLVGATSLTLSTHQEPFATSLYQQLQDPAVSRMGDAFQAAKLSLDVANNDGLREISDTFALFGDPSAHIVRPEG